MHNFSLLNPSFPVTHFSLMKPCSTLKLTQVIPISSRVFPNRLKNQSFLPKKIGFLNLSSQVEPQFGGVLEYSSRGTGLKMRASKSLIEDEAELGDWVSELRSDSFRGRRTKDSDDNGDSGRGRNGVSTGKRRREGDSDYYGNSARGRGGYSSRGRENRGSFDSNSGGSGGRGNRGSFDSSSGGSGGRENRGSFDSSSGGRGRFGGEFERRRDNDSRGYGRDSNSNEYERSSRGRGGLSSRGRGGLPNRGRGGLMGRGRGNRGSDDYGRGGYSNRGGGRGGRDSFDSRGRGRFGGEVEGRNEGYMRKENSPRDGRNSMMGRSRDDRGSGLGSGWDQGGARDRGMKTASIGFERSALMMSDTEDSDEEEDEDEEVGKLRDSMQELVSGKDSESEATEDEDDDDSLFETTSSFSRLGIKAGPAHLPINSDEGTDSYLSETR